MRPADVATTTAFSAATRLGAQDISDPLKQVPQRDALGDRLGRAGNARNAGCGRNGASEDGGGDGGDDFVDLADRRGNFSGHWKIARVDEGCDCSGSCDHLNYLNAGRFGGRGGSDRSRDRSGGRSGRDSDHGGGRRCRCRNSIA